MTESQTATQKTIVGDQTAPQGMAPTPVRPARYWSSDHGVNIRLTIPFVVKSFYITIVAGTERRSPERRAEDREGHPILTLGNIAAVAALALAVWLYVEIMSGAIAAISG